MPEPQPPDLFTKKMEPVLSNPDPLVLENTSGIPETVKVLAQNSLGRFVPQDEREKIMTDYWVALAVFRRALEVKENKIDVLAAAVEKHSLLKRFGDGDIMIVLTGLLGWREWPHWRELRRFCGLDVSRMDASGKMHISRVRPEIRQYLYLFMSMTKEGREMVLGLKGRVKKIERILKRMWQETWKVQLT